jgi:hypothetical protein
VLGRRGKKAATGIQSKEIEKECLVPHPGILEECKIFVRIYPGFNYIKYSLYADPCK